MLIDDGEGAFQLSSHLDIALTIHDSYTDLDSEIYRPIGGHCSCERPNLVKSLKRASYMVPVLLNLGQAQVCDRSGHANIADSPGVLWIKL